MYVFMYECMRDGGGSVGEDKSRMMLECLYTHTYVRTCSLLPVLVPVAALASVDWGTFCWKGGGDSARSDRE